MIHYLVKNEGCEVYSSRIPQMIHIVIYDKTEVDVESMISILNSIKLEDNTYFEVYKSLSVFDYKGILQLTYFIDESLIRHITFMNDRLLITKKPTNLTFKDLKEKIIRELTN